jgi:hypothetical protein
MDLYTDGNTAGFEYTLSLNNNKVKLPSGVEIEVDKPLVQSIIQNCNFVIPDATVNDSKY